MGVENAPLGNMGRVINKGMGVLRILSEQRRTRQVQLQCLGHFLDQQGLCGGLRPPALVRHKNPTINSTEILYSGKGHPWYSYYIYRTDGIFRSQDEIDRHISKDSETGEVKMLQPNAKVGDLRFIDTNGDGVINDDDRVLTGSYTPKQTFSFGGSFDWKGFDFSFMFQGVAGNYIYNGTKQLGMNGRQDMGNLTTDVYNTLGTSGRWTASIRVWV